MLKLAWVRFWCLKYHGGKKKVWIILIAFTTHLFQGVCWGSAKVSNLSKVKWFFSHVYLSLKSKLPLGCCGQDVSKPMADWVIRVYGLADFLLGSGREVISWENPAHSLLLCSLRVYVPSPFFSAPDQNPVPGHSPEISRSWQVSERGNLGRRAFGTSLLRLKAGKDACCLPLYNLIMYLKIEKQMVNVSPSCLSKVNTLNLPSHLASQTSISEREEVGPTIEQNWCIRISFVLVKNRRMKIYFTLNPTIAPVPGLGICYIFPILFLIRLLYIQLLWRCLPNFLICFFFF